MLRTIAMPDVPETRRDEVHALAIAMVMVAFHRASWREVRHQIIREALAYASRLMLDAKVFASQAEIARAIDMAESNFCKLPEPPEIPELGYSVRYLILAVLQVAKGGLTRDEIRAHVKGRLTPDATLDSILESLVKGEYVAYDEDDSGKYTALQPIFDDLPVLWEDTLPGVSEKMAEVGKIFLATVRAIANRRVAQHFLKQHIFFTDDAKGTLERANAAAWAVLKNDESDAKARGGTLVPVQVIVAGGVVE